MNAESPAAFAQEVHGTKACPSILSAKNTTLQTGQGGFLSWCEESHCTFLNAVRHTAGNDDQVTIHTRSSTLVDKVVLCYPPRISPYDSLHVS